MRVEPGAARASTTHYLKGNNRAQWVRHVPEYQHITYRDAAPGIDVTLYAEGPQVKYDVAVRPGADVSDFAMVFDGIERVSLDADGQLRVHHAWGRYHEAIPISYQPMPSGSVPVDVAYNVLDDRTVGFTVRGDYDPRQALVIDPLVLSWSTFMGATGYSNYGLEIALDHEGNRYITGKADDGYPTTPGAYQETPGGYLDIFVTKLNSDGSDMIYSTFIGGVDEDIGAGIVVNAAQEAFLAGATASHDFPTTPGVIQETFATHTGFPADSYILRLNSTGTDLIYSTFLGGSDYDQAFRLAINDQDEAFVVGTTWSEDFPSTPGAFQTELRGRGDVYVARINPDATTLVYATYIGGTSTVDEAAWDIALNADDEVFATGWAASPDFPTTPGAVQSTFGEGIIDAFALRLNSTGTALLAATFIGGAIRSGV